MHVALLVLSTFAASTVEMVEALTIVLAVGVTRGWRPVVLGTTGALVGLGGLVAVLPLRPVRPGIPHLTDGAVDLTSGAGVHAAGTGPVFPWGSFSGIVDSILSAGTYSITSRMFERKVSVISRKDAQFSAKPKGVFPTRILPRGGPRQRRDGNGAARREASVASGASLVRTGPVPSR